MYLPSHPIFHFPFPTNQQTPDAPLFPLNTTLIFFSFQSQLAIADATPDITNRPSLTTSHSCWPPS